MLHRMEEAKKHSDTRIFWSVIWSVILGITVTLYMNFGVEIVQVLPGALSGRDIVFPKMMSLMIIILISILQVLTFSGAFKPSDGINLKEWGLIILFFALTLVEISLQSNYLFLNDAYPSEFRDRIEVTYRGLQPQEHQTYIKYISLTDEDGNVLMAPDGSRPLSRSVREVVLYYPEPNSINKEPLKADIFYNTLNITFTVLLILASWTLGILLSLLPEIALSMLLALWFPRILASISGITGQHAPVVEDYVGDSAQECDEEYHA